MLPVDLPLSLLEDNRYFIDVHGPNGFYLSIKDGPQVPAIQIHAQYERNSRPTGNMQVRLRNDDKQPLMVVVQDHSYKTGMVTRKIAAGHEASIVLNLKQSYGWYDFTVKNEGSDLEARFAGHAETGRFGNPLMGGVV